MSRSLEKYQDKSRLDRRIVLNAVIDRHLHDVRASDPLNGTDTRPDDRLQKRSSNGSRQSLDLAATPWISEGKVTEPPSSHNPSPEEMTSSVSESQKSHENRTWVGKWAACKHSPPPVSSMHLDSSAAGEEDWSSALNRSRSSRALGPAELQGAVTATAAPDVADSATPLGSGSSGFDQPTATPNNTDSANGDSRAAICMHPGGQPGPQVPERSAADPSITDAADGATTADTPHPTPVTAMTWAFLPDHLQATSTAEGNAAAAAAWSPRAPEAEGAASASGGSAAPAHDHGLAGATGAVLGGKRGAGAAHGPAALAAVCMPFAAPDERAWYCCDLFGVDGGSAAGLPFLSVPMASPQTLGAADNAVIALQALKGGLPQPFSSPPPCHCQCCAESSARAHVARTACAVPAHDSHRLFVHACWTRMRWHRPHGCSAPVQRCIHTCVTMSRLHAVRGPLLGAFAPQPSDGMHDALLTHGLRGVRQRAGGPTGGKRGACLQGAA